MSVYRFKRWGTLWRDDHPLALYAGNARLSPPEAFVWWWPLNWIVAVVASPVILFVVVRAVYRARRTRPNTQTEQERP